MAKDLWNHNNINEDTNRIFYGRRQWPYMNLFDLTVNRQRSPVGIGNQHLVFAFKADTEAVFTARLLLENQRVLAEKQVPLKQAFCFSFDVSIPAGERLFYTVSHGTVTASTTFETAAPLTAKYITPADKQIFAPVFCRRFSLDKPVRKARLFITGLGLYRAEINGTRVGDRYLTPGYNDYDAYLRYQTYDITESLQVGENTLLVHMGDGWYRGRIGIDKPLEQGGHVFGDDYLLSADLHVEFTDGTVNDMETDESWNVLTSSCMANSIYDGEVRDYTQQMQQACSCIFAAKNYHMVADFGAPIREKMLLHPTLYTAPSGASILDFGQNMVGFVRLTATLPYGTKVTLRHGEVLQDGEFYAANLRTAKAECVYISDGAPRVYEPCFTYFGFRYVCVEGLEQVDPSQFCGVVLCSDLPLVFTCETDHEKINKLIQNTVWGQRGNFLDVPTDCPQRDERLGWTADTQVFAATACYHMDCYPFYRKYLCDLRAEQTLYYNGDLPMYAPSLKHEAGSGGAVWADCGTILPWKLYLAYGDRALLRRSYPLMQDYTETLIRRELSEGGEGLIRHSFTFGDWLAQDGVCPQSMAGGTDNSFISSVYYHESVRLTGKAANVLGLKEDAARYEAQAQRIYQAILDEYFAPGGKLALDTQTAYVLSLYYGIYRHRDRVISDFRQRLSKDFYRMKTGFTGTPLMLPTLFQCGMVDDAYRILYNEECPGWLYAINLGATTLWERWNSLLPDGKISGTHMNSLNHYVNGSVCEAIYAYIAGLSVGKPGWGSAVIHPYPHYRMKHIRFSFDSPHGIYAVEWQIKQGHFFLQATVPAGCQAQVILPDGQVHVMTAGTRKFCIPAPEALLHPFSLDTPILDILAHPQAAAALRDILPQAYAMVCGENQEFLTVNGHFIASLPMFGTDKASIEAYQKRLASLPSDII